jgi:hypothetical protein
MLSGQATFSSGTLNLDDGSSILNAGTMELGSATISGFGFGSFFGSLLHNTGTLRKAGAGEGEVSTGVDNDGTIEVTGGTLALRSLLNYSSDTESLAGGTYIARSGAGLVLSGPVEQLGARLLLDGPGSSLSFADFAGDPLGDALAPLARVAGNGELALAGGRDLATTAGLRVAGTVDLGAGSELTVNGPYSHQGAGSLLRVGVAGPALSQHGRVTATGAATLAGIVSFVTDPGFSAGPGSQLAIAGFPSRAGSYGEAKGLDPAGSTAFDLQYSDTEMKLVVAGGAAARSAEEPVVAQALPIAESDTISLDDRALSARGSWRRTRTLSVATARGATLSALIRDGRALVLRAQACRRCGKLEVYWRGRLLRRVSLRSGRRGIRLFAVKTFRLPQSGVFRLRTTSTRRVAIDALVVER